MKDRVGNNIHEGAILRWFHFRTRNKKHYMYKQVGKADDRNTWIYHLPFSEKSKGKNKGFALNNFLDEDGKVTDCVVVACCCEEHIRKDLKRSKEFKD